MSLPQYCPNIDNKLFGKNVVIFDFVQLLKGYSTVSLIDDLTHRETVLDSLLRDKVCKPLANVVLLQ